MDDQSFYTFLIESKLKADRIFHKSESDTAYRQASDLIHNIITRTVSKLKLAWDDTRNNEYSLLRNAEESLKRYSYTTSDKGKKEIIDSFKIILIDVLSLMMYHRKDFFWIQNSESLLSG